MCKIEITLFIELIVSSNTQVFNQTDSCGIFINKASC